MSILDEARKKARREYAERNGTAPPSPGGNKVNDFICLREPTLGEAAYHGFIGDFLHFASPRTEATDACILAHLVAANSTRIGPRIHVFGGDLQPCRFNVAVVGPTARGRKGTGWVPVRRLMQQAVGQFWKGQPAKGLSSGEGLIAKVADKYIEDDKVIPVEKRLLVLEPEFSKVLVQTRRDGNILSQIIREAYDSGDFSVLTKDPLAAAGAHINIIGHITPEELKKRLTEIEMANGFCNRFLWFVVRSEKLMPKAEPLPHKETVEFGKRLNSIFQFTDLLARRLCPRVKMDEEAQALWEEEYSILCRDRPGFIGALTARGSSQVLRLSLLYALLDKSNVIRLPHLQAGLAVWRYSEESVQLLFKQKSGDSLADRCYELLAGGPMLTRDFYKHIASKGEDLQAALEQLERNGLIAKEVMKTGNRGRPAERWSRA